MNIRPEKRVYPPTADQTVRQMRLELKNRFAVTLGNKRLRADVKRRLDAKRAEVSQEPGQVQGQLLVCGMFAGVDTQVLRGKTWAVGVLVEETSSEDYQLVSPLTFDKVNLTAFDFCNDVCGHLLPADFAELTLALQLNVTFVAQQLVKLFGSSSDFDSNEQTAGGTAPAAPMLGGAAELRAARLRVTEVEKQLQDAEKATKAAEAAITKAAEAARKKAQEEQNKKHSATAVVISPVQLKAIKEAAAKGGREGRGSPQKEKASSKTATTLLAKANAKHNKDLMRLAMAEKKYNLKAHGKHVEMFAHFAAAVSSFG